MEIKELISFKTIVESGTFSKAADLLYYTQPTITNHIKQLEKSLGFKLFIRGWDAKLTRQGELLYSQLDNLLDHWNYFKGVASDIEKEEIAATEKAYTTVERDVTIGYENALTKLKMKFY